MCDAIEEGDDKFEKSQKLLQEQGCYEQNKLLTECLKAHEKDWRYCQVFFSLDFEKLTHFYEKSHKSKICKFVRKIKT